MIGIRDVDAIGFDNTFAAVNRLNPGYPIRGTTDKSKYGP